MSAVDVDFNAPDLAARIEALSQYDLDNLPFGVVLLDRQGVILFYSATEVQRKDRCATRSPHPRAVGAQRRRLAVFRPRLGGGILTLLMQHVAR